MKRIINLIFAILWTLHIFSFSLQTGESSGSLSLSITDYLYRYTILIFPNLSVDTLHIILRKSAHVIEYLILGCLYLKIWIDYRLFKWLFVIAGLAVALLDEGIQLFIIGRGPSLFDAIFFDFLGFLIGGVIAYLITPKLNKI